jgi:hypothetical protein
MYEKKKDTGRYIMLDRIIKYLFALIGAFTDVSLGSLSNPWTLKR